MSENDLFASVWILFLLRDVSYTLPEWTEPPALPLFYSLCLLQKLSSIKSFHDKNFF